MRKHLYLTILLGMTIHATVAGAQLIDLGNSRLVDLTHAFSAETLYWPTSPSAFELEILSHGDTPGGYFYSANRFCSPEHGGTHLDAPIHFSDEGLTAEALPLSNLIGVGVVVDMSKKAASDPDAQLSRQDVLDWERENGTIQAGSIVLLRTGWSLRWPDRKAYFGDDAPGDASHLHFPSYGPEAAKLLVEERKVSLLGVDTASIDIGQSKDFLVHRIAAAQNVAGLENLTHLEQLPARGAVIVALPMKIQGGSGGPLRVIGIVPESSAPSGSPTKE